MGRVDAEFHDSKLTQIINEMEGAAVIAYTAEYAPYVEFPTEYTTGPNLGAIRKWVDQKWNDLSDDLKTDDQGRELTKDEVASKVYWILNTYGTDGVYYGTRALERMRQDADRFARAYEQSNDPNAPRKLLEDISDYGFELSQDIVSEEAVNEGNLLQSGQISITDDPSEVPDNGD